MFSLLIMKIYLSLPAPVRRSLSSLKKKYVRLRLRMQLRPIRVDACLLGGDNGVSAAGFARMVGDIRRPSRSISEWPHVKLLRQYDRIGDQIWNRQIFEETEYYRNAVINIEMCGRYFDAVTPDQIQLGARRFINLYCGISQNLPPQIGQSDEWNENEYITVHPVKYSTCYQVQNGHHQLAIAYMKGIHEISGFIRPPAVTTPLQDLLLDVLWRDREEPTLYQPIDSPDVAEWILLRRCTDRLAKMTGFLQANDLMPPASSNYLDVASYFGWFVAEMQKAGFQAEGVERDPVAISVGRLMYNLTPEQVHRTDCVSFLRTHRDGYDVTSCFSLLHHYILNRLNVSAEELLGLLDSATRRVMFFEMGQSGEKFPWGKRFEGWDSDRIHHWLEVNTTFTRIVRLGADEDDIPPYRGCYGRTLFACQR
jgi:hypothetical protein